MFSPMARKRVGQYLLIILGASILSFGLYNVHSQANITEGGVLGMTLLLHHWFGISPGITGFFMDMSCYLLAFKFFGKAFAKYALVASLTFSLSYRLFEHFPPLLPDLSPWPILAAIAGGTFVGLGVGLVVRIGGASGGDDALAMVISKFTHWPLSRTYLFTDLTVLLLSLSYIPLRQIIFSLITVTISSFLIEWVVGFGKKPQEVPKEKLEAATATDTPAD